jgi:hypothetical protein
VPPLRKEKSKEFLKRRLYEEYRIFCGHYPDFTAVSAINAVMARGSSGGGSLLESSGLA